MLVWVQRWEESERGWGTRPDGYTIHKVAGDIPKFVVFLRAKEAQSLKPGEIPDTYSRPEGLPYLAEVGDTHLAELEKCAFGIWGRGEPPVAVDPSVPV